MPQDVSGRSFPQQRARAKILITPAGTALAERVMFPRALSQSLRFSRMRYRSAGQKTKATLSSKSRDSLNMAVSIYKIDLSSGSRELWQVIKPSLTSFNMSVSTPAITPDGHWMVHAYRLNAGQLYISTNLR
jgi:carotenoid cleavage dioxygenase-like enzyme